MKSRRQLTSAQVAIVRNYPPTNKALRFSKSQLKKMGLPYDGGGLVRLHGQIYAFVESKTNAQKSHLIGEGGSGKIKLLQNVEKPHDLKALKVLGANGKPKVDGETEKKFIKELEITSALGRGFIELIHKIGGRKQASICGIVDLVPGITLKQYAKTPWQDAGTNLQIALLCLLDVEKLHDHSFIHCDINARNFIFNFITCVVRAIDFGLTEYFEPGTTTPVTNPLGTPGYIDPATFPITNENGQSIPGVRHPKNDVFSLGILIKELFGIDYKYNILIHGSISERDSYGSSRAKGAFGRLSSNDRTAILELTAKMTAENLSERCELKEAIQVLKAIFKNYESQISAIAEKKDEEQEYLSEEAEINVADNFIRALGLGFTYNEEKGIFTQSLVMTAEPQKNLIVLRCLNQEIAAHIHQILSLSGMMVTHNQSTITFEKEQFDQLKQMSFDKVSLLTRISNKHQESDGPKKIVLESAAKALMTGAINNLKIVMHAPENNKTGAGWSTGLWSHKTWDLVKEVLVMLNIPNPERVLRNKT